eukprot:CAMPEP_0168417892 /NCGR_PEP_ID=MMETSP0228-20121227/31486_1 /TAXON_ID=133427 /ORGANISM="Protoceratium reticulatum, Strain CCCM 535 (=CCMP 1889)" /LENGTH=252 /DNA_ID=CAMNT_0008431755 /DNA_START=31 /DNA_END=789 /DNA_ORIENTATION=-
MPSRRSKSREKTKKDARHEKREAPLKQEPGVQLEVIDLEEDSPAPTPVKAEVKREVKAEPREARRAKAKKAKVKKEKRDEEVDVDLTRDAGKRRCRSSSPPRRRKRSRSRSSSSSSSSSSESQSALYRKFRPYTKVQLVNLVRKADLNGMTGQVIHPSCAVSPCPPGCLLVRLETGREIAVKPPNIAPLKAFHVGPQQAKQSQEDRLQQVLSQIKTNVDNVMERTMAIRDTDGSCMLLDDSGAVQGGIGHML